MKKKNVIYNDRGDKLKKKLKKSEKKKRKGNNGREERDAVLRNVIMCV